MGGHPKKFQHRKFCFVGGHPKKISTPHACSSHAVSKRSLASLCTFVNKDIWEATVEKHCNKNAVIGYSSDIDEVLTNRICADNTLSQRIWHLVSLSYRVSKALKSLIL